MTAATSPIASPSAMASDAPSRVFTSTTLFRIITSYQRGVPSAVFHFWCAHAENSKIPKAQHHSTFAKRLEHLPAFVAAHGDVHLLALLPLITESFPQRRWSRVCREAAKKKDVVMLRWAIDQGYLHVWDALLVRDLIRLYECGDFRVLSVVENQHALLQSISPTFLTTRKLYHLLMDVALIEWLRMHVPQLEWRWERVVKKAVVHGQLEVLRHVYACAPSTKWNIALLQKTSPLMTECWSCIRFLLQHHTQQMTGGEWWLILATARVEILEIVREVESLRRHVTEATRMAVSEHKMEVLHRFESTGLVTSDRTMDITQWRMNDMVLYLLERRLGTVTGGAMDRAAVATRWDIVRYIHDHFTVQCTTTTMDEAAEQGRLDIVKFLHEHRTEGCSSRALERAAARDNLTLVRYLSEVVQAPGTTEAMDQAAAKGHVKVFKYLHTHRTGGCTSGTVRKALENDRHAVVQYLFTHCRHIFDATVLETLLVHGEFEIWETLREQYPEEAETSILPAVKSATSKCALRTIRYIVHTLGRSDLARVAMETATQRHVLSWVAAVWRITGPQSCTMAAVHRMIDSGYSYDDVTKFVIDHCVELDAKERAIQYAKRKGKHRMVEQLQTEWTTTPTDSVKLHPWLVDERTPTWVVRQLCHSDWDGDRYIGLWYERVTSTHWPIQAAYRRDCTVLAMALEASRSSDTAADPKLSFDGARAAAVRIGHLPTLRWLLEHVDLQVEPTLLDAALFYHRYEVAMWLASHCPEACTAVGPPRAKSRFYHDCGYDWSLREWLESAEGEAVRSVLDIESLKWDRQPRAPSSLS